MAGAGYKLFASGDVLTAAQVNTYLNEQTVMVFATSAARTSALSAVLAEGMMSYLQDSNTVYYYDGSAWNALASGDITAITAGTGISVTSGTGPVPTVAIDTAVTVDKTTAQTLTNKTLTTPIISSISNTGTLTLPTSTDTLIGRATTDTLTNKTLTSPALTTPTISTLTTNGDVLYGTGSGALSRLGIGSTSQVLTVTGGVPVWATPSGGGGFTLLETLTIPASTTTVTSASISSSYKHLVFVFSNIFTTTSNNLDTSLRFNSDSGSNYVYARVDGQDSSVSGGNSGGATTQFPSGSFGGDSNYNLNGVLWVYRYTDTTRRTVTYQQMGGISSGGNSRYSFFTGGYKGSSAISTFTMARIQTDATFQGTVYIYGVS